jgi:cation transport ATPase
MQFQDTRLYELVRWIVAFAIGFLCMVLILQKAFSPLFRMSADEEALWEQKMQLSQSISAMEQKLDSLNVEQRDRLINLEREHTKLADPFNDKVRKVQILMLVVMLLIFGLSFFVAQPMVRLVLAALGTVFALYNLYFGSWHLLLLQFNEVYLLLLVTILCAAAWDLVLKKRADSARFIAVQVVAAISLAGMLYVKHVYFLETAEASQLRNQRQEVRMQRKENERMQHALISKDHLNDSEKQQFIDLKKEHKLFESTLSRLENISVPRQQKRSWIFYALIAAILLTVGIVVRKPMYLSFGCIFGAMLYMVSLWQLPWWQFSVAPFLALVALLGALIYFLYRQPRDSKA